MIIVHHLDREQAKSRECPAYDTLARTDGHVELNDSTLCPLWVNLVKGGDWMTARRSYAAGNLLSNPVTASVPITSANVRPRILTSASWRARLVSAVASSTKIMR